MGWHVFRDTPADFKEGSVEEEFTRRISDDLKTISSGPFQETAARNIIQFRLKNHTAHDN